MLTSLWGDIFAKYLAVEGQMESCSSLSPPPLFHINLQVKRSSHHPPVSEQDDLNSHPGFRGRRDYEPQNQVDLGTCPWRKRVAGGSLSGT